MSAWRGAREHRPGSPFEVGPCSWLLANVALLPRGGRTLDLACGAGRHALLLAAAGFPVRAVDRDAATLEALAGTAARLGLPLQVERLDLEAGEVSLGKGSCDLIVVIHYLHRPLFPAILRALAPGGLLLYETFTIDQAQRGRPTNPDFLLRHGELPQLVQGLEILRQREGEFEERCVAAVAARKASAG